MKFEVIVADPPWQFSDRLTMSDVPRGSASNYETLGIDDIVKLPVSQIAADGSVLFLWCPASLLSPGLCAMESWGFEHKQLWTWVKTGKGVVVDAEEIPDQMPLAFGMGRLARNACEFLLVGTRGKVYDKLQNRSVRNVFFAPVLKHSAKPECVQDAIDTMFPTLTKLELFARRTRSGWVCTGLECPGSVEDVRDFISHAVEEGRPCRDPQAELPIHTNPT